MRLTRAALHLTLAAGSAAITWASRPYFDPDELAPFVLEKLPLAHEAWWLFMLKLHVVSSSLALPACLLLSSTALLRRAPAVHRWLGRVTAVIILAGLVPSGAWLASTARGGAWGALGFLVSGAVVTVNLVRAVATARRGDLASHRHASRHVLAQLAVAVVSRALLFSFDALNLVTDGAYLFTLWGPVLAAVVLVERSQAPRVTRSPHEAQPPVAGVPAGRDRVRLVA